jgi:hypothetical protein
VYRRIGVIHDDHRYEAFYFVTFQKPAPESRGTGGAGRHRAGAQSYRWSVDWLLIQSLAEAMIAVEFETWWSAMVRRPLRGTRVAMRWRLLSMQLKPVLPGKNGNVDVLIHPPRQPQFLEVAVNKAQMGPFL